MAFVGDELTLNEPQADGATLRHHLQAVWSKTGEKPQQLVDAAECPRLAAHVYGWFASLNNERGNNGMSVLRITADDVKNWAWFNGLAAPELWERRAIAAMDDVWMRQHQETRHDD